MNKKSLYISRILSNAEKTRSRGQIKPFSATTHAENRVIRKRPKLLCAIYGCNRWVGILHAA